MECFGTVAIVGVGLIGGSIGQALRARGLADHVVGVGRDAGRLAEAQKLGAIDRGVTDLIGAAAEADVIVVCTPVDRIAADIATAARHLRPTSLITDAGSTKQAIVTAAEADPASLSRFVGAHPIAGSERAGVAYAREDLFTGRVCVLTPTERTARDKLGAARRFWSAIGARLIELDPISHDNSLARTSHLPHVLAAALASLVGPQLAPLAAGAYRDVTRVASAEAALWTAIFLENKGAILQALDEYNGRLDEFRDALQASDSQAISRWWNLGRENRRVFDSQIEGESIASEGSGE